MAELTIKWQRQWQAVLAAVAAGEERPHVLLRACIVLFALNSLLFYFLPGTFHDTRVNIAVACGQLLLLPASRKPGWYLYVMHASLVLSAILVCFVALQSGGINSLVLMWFCTILLAALLLGGVFHGLVWCALVQGVLLLVWLASEWGYGVKAVVFKTPMLWVISISLVLSVLVPYLIVQIYDQLNRKQLQLLDEKNSDLRSTHEAIRLAQTHKDEFVAATGHELRTPMSAILGLNGILREHVAGHPDQVEAVDHIRRSTQQLLGVINNILDFSQLQAGQLRLQPDWMDIKGTLEEVLDEHRDKALSKALKVHWQMGAGVPAHVMLDRLRFKQLVGNLLDNAIRYSPDGATVGLFLTIKRDTLRLDVHDQGPGIPFELQSRIFKRFENSDEGRPETSQGTGLGLSICQQLMELHGGRIGVNSARGNGATFWVEWPITKETPDAFEHHAVGVHRVLALDILVVDDDAINRMVTELQLRKAMPLARITTVAGAQQALNILQTASWDVVLLDVYMPGMSGLELASWIREQPAPLRHLALIGLTASTHPEDWQRCLDAGMNGVLSKPLDVQRIVQTIHRHWRWGSERS